MPECKVNIEAQTKTPCFATHAGIATCELCGKPMCPKCHRHKVTQLSRVTGYVSSVDGWNQGKQQELKDRKRYGGLNGNS